MPNRLYKDIDVVAMYGAFYTVMVPLSIFMIIFERLCREKIDYLRRGMQLLGTGDLAYWTSWLITAFLLNVVTSIEMVAIGRYLGFEIYERSPFLLMFMLLFLTTTAYITMAIFLSTIIETRNQAFIVNFSLSLISLVSSLVFSEPTILKKIFFNVDNKPWIKWTTNIFYMNPCFQYGKCFADISCVVCSVFDPQSLNWIKQDGHFKWSDMYREQHGVFFSKDRFHVVSMVDTLYTYVHVIAFYATLAWYFDNTLPANRGVPKPWNFPFMLSYWLPCLQKKKASQSIRLDSIVANSGQDTALEEKN